MTTFVQDPMQQACDEAGGVEGQRLHHNCKEGSVYLDGVAVQAISAAFLMEEAAHGWVQFDDDQKLIDKDIKRFVHVAPDKGKMNPARKPNTSCLCVIEGTSALATYTGSSWSSRSAFIAQLLKPFQRARKLGIVPIASLGFKPGQKDEHGNYVPCFTITGWAPRAKFALILGEGDTSLMIQAKTDIINALPPVEAETAPAVVDEAEMMAETDAYAGVDPTRYEPDFG
jgi:hypothetical protein